MKLTKDKTNRIQSESISDPRKTTVVSYFNNKKGQKSAWQSHQRYISNYSHPSVFVFNNSECVNNVL